MSIKLDCSDCEVTAKALGCSVCTDISACRTCSICKFCDISGCPATPDPECKKIEAEITLKLGESISERDKIIEKISKTVGVIHDIFKEVLTKNFGIAIGIQVGGELAVKGIVKIFTRGVVRQILSTGIKAIFKPINFLGTASLFTDVLDTFGKQYNIYIKREDIETMYRNIVVEYNTQLNESVDFKCFVCSLKRSLINLGKIPYDDIITEAVNKLTAMYLIEDGTSNFIGNKYCTPCFTSDCSGGITLGGPVISDASENTCPSDYIDAYYELYNDPNYTDRFQSLFGNYTFYQGVDSIGSDLLVKNNLAGNIPALKKICSETPGCVGFNSAGILKSSLKPDIKLVSVPEWKGEKQGIYKKTIGSAFQSASVNTNKNEVIKQENNKYVLNNMILKFLFIFFIIIFFIIILKYL
jgi:hypothetical protein